MQRRDDPGAVVQLVADDVGLEGLNHRWLIQRIVDGEIQVDSCGAGA
jgi:hypothetical protein